MFNINVQYGEAFNMTLMNDEDLLNIIKGQAVKQMVRMCRFFHIKEKKHVNENVSCGTICLHKAFKETNPIIIYSLSLSTSCPTKYLFYDFEK